MTELEEFGERLRGAIKARKKTQVAVAEAIGVTPQAVSKWMNGGHIDEANLAKLADHLQVDKAWLRYGAARALEVGIAGDILSVTKARKVGELLEGLQRVNFLLSVLGIGAWEINLLTGDTYWSSDARTLIGVGHGDAIDDAVLRSIFVDDDMDAMSMLLADARPGQMPARYKLRFRDNHCNAIDMVHACMPDPAGISNRVVGFAKVSTYI
ncbi:helix-turn-helix domain-containing protein [Burkholderia gladioli]|uniref:helix-turn-helix domain-containing protein n=1 Tax=Burkholderia gladioli TaxID=28095 RepID=UPI003B512FE3